MTDREPPPPSLPQQGRRRGRRILAWTAGILAVLVLLVAAALAAGWIWLGTAGGRSWLIATLDRTAAPAGSTMRIAAIDGSVPDDMTLRGISLADATGTWLTIDRLHLAWRPLALLHGLLAVDALDFGRVTLDRLPPPAPGSAAPAAGQQGGGVPRLPVAVHLGYARIDVLRLGPALFGQSSPGGPPGAAQGATPGATSTTIRAIASLDAAAGGPVHLTLRAVGIDQAAWHLSADADYRPGPGSLTGSVELNEPAGGLVARLAGLPNLPAFNLSIVGTGDRAFWNGRLRASLGGGAGTIAADLALRAGNAVTVHGAADIARLIAPKLAPLAAGGVTLDAAAKRGGDGTITISGARLSAAAGTLHLSGRTGPAGIDLDATLDAGNASAFAGLAPGWNWRQMTADLQLRGSETAPIVAGTMAGQDIAGPGVSAGAVQIGFGATPVTGSAGRYAATLDAGITRLAGSTPALARLAGPTLRLSAAARLDATAGSARIERLSLTGAGAVATLSGSVGRGSVDLAADASLDDLKALGLPLPGLAGGASLGVLLHADPAAGTGTLDATLFGQNLATGTPADAVLGPLPSVALRVQRQADGTVRLAALHAAASDLDLTGSGTWSAGRLDGTTHLVLADLAPLGSALGTALAGGVTVDTRIGGTDTAPTVHVDAKADRLALAGRAVGPAQATIEAAAGQGGATAQVALQAGAADRRLTLQARLGTDGRRLMIDRLDAGIAGARLSGAATVPLSGGPGDMTLHLMAALTDGSALSRLLGQPVSGRAQATLTLAPGGPGWPPVADAAASADGLVLGPASVTRLKLTAHVTDPFGRPGGNADLAATGVDMANLALQSATLRVQGTPARLRLDAAADGRDRVPFSVRTGGTLSGLDVAPGAARRLRLVLDRFDGTVADQPVRLEPPATLALEGARASLALRLDAAGGRLAADLASDGKTASGQVTVAHLPLSLARLVAPGLAMAGTADAGLKLSGRLDDPTADLTLRLAGVHETGGAGAVPVTLNLTAEARLANRRVALTATAMRAGSADRLDFSGHGPLAVSPGGVSVPANGAVDGRLDGRIDLAVANDLLATTGDRAGGTAMVAIRLAGTVGQPRLGGSMTLAGGHYQNVASGIALSDIAGTLAGNGAGLDIRNLSARTAGGGRLGLAGRIGFGPGGTLAVTLTARNARVFDTDLGSAETNADLRLSGSFAAPRIAGQVTILRADIRIPDALPPTVVDLKPIYVGGGAVPIPGHKPPVPGASQGGPSFDPALAISIKALNQIFVRGRGVDSEFAASMQVGGTLSQPMITGGLTLVRGQMDLLSKIFTFQSGSVTFPGAKPANGGLDPALALVATAQGSDITATITVGGTASAPTITLSSSPSLPQDEVLSRLLFNKSTTQLSPLEAAQLAQSVAALTGAGGSGGGLIDKVRQALGIDRLGTTASGAIEAGKYLTRNVYVGVGQNPSTGASQVTATVDVTRRIKIESDLGSDGNSTVGVTAEWNY